MRKGYNERLFASGLRKWLHLARFKWIAKKFKKIQPRLDCVLELGCFDGKVLDFIPPPIIYHGYDANWEGGLILAKKRESPSCHFHFCLDPINFANLDSKEKATAIISMETLEHIPVELLDAYLNKAKDVLDGYFFITVPNEMGLLFAVKYLFKLILGDSEEYSFREYIAAIFGKMEIIKRKEHKGFSWKDLMNQLKKYFDLVEVEGIQFPQLPLWANFQIGMILKSRPLTD